MLRRTDVCLHFRARAEFDRIRSMMRGRAKLERKIGIKQMTFIMRTQTAYRVELQSYWEKRLNRKRVDSAAVEHGVGWGPLKNDLARQDVLLSPTAQHNLATYEPLAFRAVVELASSKIPPPALPASRPVPPEAYEPRPTEPNTCTKASTKELSEMIDDIMARPLFASLAKEHNVRADGLLDAWKEFEHVDSKKRLSYARNADLK